VGIAVTIFLPSFLVVLIRAMVAAMVDLRMGAQALARVVAQEPVDMPETVVMGLERMQDAAQLPVLAVQVVVETV
jgi:hypothetical protein